MTAHDYAFFMFTAIVAALLFTARWFARRGSPIFEATSGTLLDEFVVNFLRPFRPLILGSTVVAMLAVVGGIQAGLKVLLLLGAGALVISISFSMFKLLRFKSLLVILVGNGYALLVVLYVVFTLIYFFQLSHRLAAP